MQFVVISFSHKNVAIALRDKLAFSEDERALFLATLCAKEGLNEALLLSTCNRLEIYAVVCDEGNRDETSLYILEVLAKAKDSELHTLQNLANILFNELAITHVFNVASSLDSLVVGETQITGQLKEAYKFANEHGFCGKELGNIIVHAFRCAAKIRNSLDIGNSHTSVASVGVNLLISKLRDFHTKIMEFDNIEISVAVLGAGEMGRLALKYLQKKMPNAKLTLINRTMENAKKLADELNKERATQGFCKSSMHVKNLQNTIRVSDISTLQTHLDSAHIFISATSAPGRVICKEMINPKEHTRVWLDLALPYDIEEVQVKNLYIYRIDDLKEIIQQNLALREQEAQKGELIIKECVKELLNPYSDDASKFIGHIRKLAKDASIQELQKAIKKGFLPKDLEENILKTMHNTFNVFLHNPTLNIKKLSEEGRRTYILAMSKAIFDYSPMEEDKHTKENLLAQRAHK